MDTTIIKDKKVNDIVIKESDCSLLAFQNTDNINNLDQTCLSTKIINKVGGIKKINEIKKDANCDNDICLLEVIPITNEEKSEELIRIKPEGPRNSNKWYSNFNIDDYFYIMEKSYPKYLHIQFTTIDFAKINDRLNNVSVVDLLQSDKSQFGCVINTDISVGKGKHWFAVFCDLDKINKKMSIEFFNSSGNKPKFEVQEWMIKQKNICEKNNIVGDIVIASMFRHQYSDTECGPYSCYYITKRIMDVPYEYFKTNKIPDEVVEDFRKYMFRASE